MTDAYNEEFIHVCDLFSEKLKLSKEFVQESVANVGLRLVRSILSDVSIYSGSDIVYYDSSIQLELYVSDDWLKYRLEAAWKMIVRISEGIKAR